MAKSSTSFKPGQSGNPEGRAPKTEEQKLLEVTCRELTDKALSTIQDIMTNSKNERNRLAAAQYILDRGWGKPTQARESPVKNEEPLNITVNFV